MKSFDDYEPVDAKEDWVHVDDLPDFHEMIDLVEKLELMLDRNEPKESIRSVIEELRGMIP